MLAVGSGSWRGVGESLHGGKRPRGPSGEDGMDVPAGVFDNEVADGVTAEAGVRATGTAVTICGEANCAEPGDRLSLTGPLARTGEGMAEGAIFLEARRRMGLIAGLSAMYFGSLRKSRVCHTLTCDVEARRKPVQVLLHASRFPEDETWAARIINEGVGQYGGSPVRGKRVSLSEEVGRFTSVCSPRLFEYESTNWATGPQAQGTDEFDDCFWCREDVDRVKRRQTWGRKEKVFVRSQIRELL